MSEENGSIEVSGSVGPQGVTGSAKGRKVSEFIAILSGMGTVLLAYMLFTHGQASERDNQSLAAAIKELAKSQQLSVAAQREMTCIISLPQEKRETEFNSPFGFCKRLTAPQ